MSAKSTPSPKPADQPSTAATPRDRRIANPRPRKPAKAGTAPAEIVQAPVALTEAPAYPVFRSDWPEPEPASAGSSSPAENPKRKRRRKKGKGNSPHNAATPGDGDSMPPPTADTSPPTPPTGDPTPPIASTAPIAPPPPQAPTPRPDQPPRAKIDPDLLARRAWKIYLSEISEEGVALVGDNDAKELARRCFRLAEIFITEEQSRRR
jgi:hypothetical protein